MIMSNHTVVVAIDPVSGAEALTRQALQVALSYGARLVVVSVTPRYEGNMNRLKIRDADREMSEPFLACMKEAAEIAASSGVQVETVHLTGDPADCITHVAEEAHADFIVIGSPRASQLGRLILGMTTARIIKESPCDVLLMPEGVELDFSKILVGIDGSSYSMAAGQRALELGLAYGGTVHALTVIDLPPDKALRYGVMKEAHSKGLGSLQVLTGQGKKLGVKVVTAIQEGVPYTCLVDYAKAHSIPLIVMGSFGRTAFERALMGSVVERVASLSSKPTLVVSCQ